MVVALITVLASLAPVVLEKLIGKVNSYVEYGRKSQREVERMRKAVPKIQAVIKAVALGQITNCQQGLEGWIRQLRDVLDEAEDVLDELKYRELEEQMKKRTKYASKHFPSLERLMNCLTRLDEVTADVSNLIDTSAASSVHQKHKESMEGRATGSIVSAATGAVLGRLKERDHVIQLLLESNSATSSSSNDLNILPIVGVGGVGKTTLAQYVYNDSRVEEHFDLRIWVFVSNVFDPTILTRKILEGAVGSRPAVDNLAILQNKLISELRSRRYLLVLDDVWNDNDSGSWEIFLAPLRYGNIGSRILVTSRSENVKKMHLFMMDIYHLGSIQNDAFWLLFKRCVFRDEVSPAYQKLEGIGKQIANKLKGHPLAAMTITRLLREKLDDEVYWLGMLENISSHLGKGENNVMSSLRLSYQQLPANLQSCFRYCSIFSPDDEVDKDTLVHMWIGAGLVEQRDNETLEDTGKRYFDDLLKMFVFSVHRSEFKDAKNCYKMHHLLRDLAVSVSAGECLRVSSNNGGAVRIPETIRHLAVEADDTMDVIKEIIKLKHLRTLLFSYKSGDKGVDLQELKQLKSRGLRVLYLFVGPCPPRNQASLEFLGDLIHLRYLDPGWSLGDALPKSLCKLYHLQVLKVKGSSFSPPQEMSNLINLRHIISDEKSFFKFQGFGKLSSLQNFHYCVENTSGYKMEQLGEMNELRELCISDLHHIEHAGEASKAKLKEKKHIKRLELSWGSTSSVEPAMAKEILHQLEPHCSLQNLEINGYTGMDSPVWMTNLSLANLKCLHLQNCSNWKHLPPLGQLKFLRSLCLQKCPKLLVVGRGLLLPSSLESLTIVQCRLNDKSLSMCLGGLTSLSNLRIAGKHDDNMEQLTSLPSAKVLSQLTSLQDLTISEFPKLTGMAGLRDARALRTLKLIVLPRTSWIPLPTSLERLSLAQCHPELVKRWREARRAGLRNMDIHIE